MAYEFLRLASRLAAVSTAAAHGCLQLPLSISISGVARIFGAQRGNDDIFTTTYTCALLNMYLGLEYFYLRRRLASGEGILSLGVTQSICVSAEPRLHVALVSAASAVSIAL